MATLKEKTAQGLFWGLINNGSVQLLSLIFGILLARKLTPDDYGIVGMIAIFSALASCLQESGFGAALINIKNIKEIDYNTVFWFNVAVGIVSYIILYLAAPLIASFFHQPCLINLSRFVFITLLISAVGIAPNAILNRNLMVKEKTIIGFFAMTISGIVGITLAYNGFSYWSLAWQQVLFILVYNVGRYYYTRWHPRFIFDSNRLKSMFGFSYKLLITYIINNVYSNLLSFVFGRLFRQRADIVGYYNQANKWNTMAFSFVSSTLAQVAQPVFATINDDLDRQGQVLRKMIRFAAFLSFPAMFGLSLVAKEFIVILLGDKWLESVKLLQILCIGGAFMPFYTIYQNLFVSMGKSATYMWFNTIQILLVLTVVLLFHKWGLTIMVTAFTILNILMLLPWQLKAKKETGVTLAETLKDIIPFLLVASLTMAITYIITFKIENIYLLFILRVIIAVIIYLCTLKLLHAKILNECIDFIINKIKK